MDADDGKFFLINNILCKSAESDGAFRPADVFASVDASFSLNIMQHLSATIPLSDRDKEIETDTGETNASFLTSSVQLDLDDPIFNSFGILSKGILIDPWTGVFMDFTDQDIYVPALLNIKITPQEQLTQRVDKVAEHVLPEKNDVVAVAALRGRRPGSNLPKPPKGIKMTVETDEMNMYYYKSGEFANIQPRAVLTLCSSIDPLDASVLNTEPFNNGMLKKTQAYWPYCTSTLSHSAARKVARFQHQHVLTHCVFPEKAMQDTRTYQIFWQRLNKLENYRLQNKVRKPPSTYLPAGIPFGFQCNGYMLQEAMARELVVPVNEPSIENKEETHEFTPSFDAEMLVAKEDPISVPYMASSFGCFTGKPTMRRGGHSTIRNDIAVRLDAPSLPSEIREYVVPLKALSRKRSREMLDELRQPYLCIPTQMSWWSLAWWLFYVYFRYLGLEALPNPALPAHDSADMNSKSIDSREVTPLRYRLCSDENYSVAAQVQHKCCDEKVVRMAHIKNLSMTRSTIPLNKSEVADAWNYLICHDRDRLMNRLRMLGAYISKLHQYRKTMENS